MPEALIDPSLRPAKPSDRYTAIIHVHGIGRHARHENLGRLLEALEEHCDEADFGLLRSFRARTEPPRSGGSDDVPFMQFDRFEPRRHPKTPKVRWEFKGRFRAYEVYWSPITARGAHPAKVGLWAFRQLFRPTGGVKVSWRRSTFLRIARLHSLRTHSVVPIDEVEARGQSYLFASLLAFIQRFRGYEGSRHQGRAGIEATGPEDFKSFVETKLGAEWHARIGKIVDGWNKERLPVERLVRGLLWQLIGIAVAVTGCFVGLVRSVGQSGANDPLPVLGLIILIAIAVYLTVAGANFLALTFADVFIWNSNRDHDREFSRREVILAHTRTLFEHVVADENCKRVVIVSHSLGTAISLETLLLIGRRNEARLGTRDLVQLGKLSHFFTLGSPIDKIFYFFQTREAESYRAGRLYDDLRGNLSREPFFRNGRQRVRWLNLWDRVDVVSDPLFTPLGNQVDGSRIRAAAIDNHEVENTRTFSPVNSHVGYFGNHEVVASIAAALFKNEVQKPQRGPPYRSTEIARALHGALRLAPAALAFGSLVAVFINGWCGLVTALTPATYYLAHRTVQAVTRMVNRFRRAK